jgi:hypothetical protein
MVKIRITERLDMIARTGGCQCGALRYRIEGAVGDAAICHCRMCQKAFGSWGAALVSVPFEQFTWTRGHPGVFRSSSIVDRGFCATCGTPLFMRDDGDPIIELAIGTLDDPSDIPPLSHQNATESRLPWFEQMHRLPEQHMWDYCTPEDMKNYATRQHPDHDTDLWPPKELK